MDLRCLPALARASSFWPGSGRAGGIRDGDEHGNQAVAGGRSVRVAGLAVLLFGAAMFAAWMVPGSPGSVPPDGPAECKPALPRSSSPMRPLRLPVLSRLRHPRRPIIMAIAVALSHNRKQSAGGSWPGGSGSRLFAIFVLRIPAGQRCSAARQLRDRHPQLLVRRLASSSSASWASRSAHRSSHLGVIFAFQLLPAIIFVIALFRHHVLPRHHAARRAGLRRS